MVDHSKLVKVKASYKLGGKQADDDKHAHDADEKKNKVMAKKPAAASHKKAVPGTKTAVKKTAAAKPKPAAAAAKKPLSKPAPAKPTGVTKTKAKKPPKMTAAKPRHAKVKAASHKKKA